MQSLDGLFEGLTPQPSHSTVTWKQEALSCYQLTEGWKGFSKRDGGINKREMKSSKENSNIRGGKYELINKPQEGKRRCLGMQGDLQNPNPTGRTRGPCRTSRGSDPSQSITPMSGGHTHTFLVLGSGKNLGSEGLRLGWHPKP